MKQKNENIEKTNAMRILDSASVNYKVYDYTSSAALSGVEVADFLKIDRDRVFKTLVTVGKSGNNYVFMIPVAQELDLKKAASATKEKYIEMVKSRDLLPLTGYIHGGCSPIGMKKVFPTFVDETAILYDSICFSGGKIGYQVEVEMNSLPSVLSFTIIDLCV